MKRAVSLILAVAILCGLLCTGAFAADTDALEVSGKYKLDLGAFALTKEDLTFREYDYTQDKVAGVVKSVNVVHMNVGDSFTFTAQAENVHPSLQFLCWTPDDVGYTNTTSLDGEWPAIGTAKKYVIEDPVPLHEYLAETSDLSQAKFIIKCTVSSDGFESAGEELLVFYIILKNNTSAGGQQPPKPTEPAQPAKPAEPTKPANTTQPAAAANTYTVKQGDTMAVIALNNYGSYAYASKLQAANSAAFAKTGGKLNAGMVLTLPDKLGNAARLAAPVAATGESLYTVKSGDCLWNLAYKTYGNGELYKIIYERNKDRIKSNYMVYVGQTIVIPAKPAK